MSKFLVAFVVVAAATAWAPALIADDFTATNGGHWK